MGVGGAPTWARSEGTFLAPKKRALAQRQAHTRRRPCACCRRAGGDCDLGPEGGPFLARRHGSNSIPVLLARSARVRIQSRSTLCSPRGACSDFACRPIAPPPQAHRRQPLQHALAPHSASPSRSRDAAVHRSRSSAETRSARHQRARKSPCFPYSMRGTNEAALDDVETRESEWLRAHRVLSRLARERAGADAEEGRWLLAAARSAVHVHLGFASFNEYIERLFGYSPRSTQERLRVAAALERLPAAAKALQEGELTGPQRVSSRAWPSARPSTNGSNSPQARLRASSSGSLLARAPATRK